jgi:hypothetical protein
VKNILLRTFLLGVTFVAGLTLHADPALAGHAGLKGQSLDAESVKAVLLGKKITVGDARVVIIIAKTSAAQDAFLQSQIAMTTSQYQNHWRRLFMTGGGTAPKIVETEDEAVKLAAETPGAVVIADSAKVGSLTVLAAK